MAKLRPKAGTNSKPQPSFTEEDVNPLDIRLDTENPRLSPEERGKTEGELLVIMIRRFKIEELGISIVASGFTNLDPILCYRSKQGLVVREGNRRVAALKLLIQPSLVPEKYRKPWEDLSQSLGEEGMRAIRNIRVLVYPNVNDIAVESYIGFRHVSGVLEWPAEEKARFIVEMVDSHGWSYKEIADRIGSYARHVERHYIASRLIEQSSKLGIPGHERISFGVLLRALQAGGISEFLGIKYPAVPAKSMTPVPESKRDNLEFFVAATFGTDDSDPILPESRDLTRWGRILQSAEAVKYLKTSSRASFERAWLKSGGKQQSVVEMVDAAADNLEDCVALLPDFKNDAEVATSLERCAKRLDQALRDFPKVRKAVFGDATSTKQ